MPRYTSGRSRSVQERYTFAQLEYSTAHAAHTMCFLTLQQPTGPFFCRCRRPCTGARARRPHDHTMMEGGYAGELHRRGHPSMMTRPRAYYFEVVRWPRNRGVCVSSRLRPLQAHGARLGCKVGARARARALRICDCTADTLQRASRRLLVITGSA